MLLFARWSKNRLIPKRSPRVIMGKVSNFWTFFSAWYSRKMKLIFFGIFESFSKVRNFHARLSVHFSEFRSARVNFFGLNCESALKNFTFCFTFPDWKNCFALGWEFQPPRVRSASLILFRKRKINHFQIRPEVINFACVWKIGRSTKTSPDFSFKDGLKVGGRWRSFPREKSSLELDLC